MVMGLSVYARYLLLQCSKSLGCGVCPQIIFIWGFLGIFFIIHQYKILFWLKNINHKTLHGVSLYNCILVVEVEPNWKSYHNWCQRSMFFAFHFCCFSSVNTIVITNKHHNLYSGGNCNLKFKQLMLRIKSSPHFLEKYTSVSTE